MKNKKTRTFLFILIMLFTKPIKLPAQNHAAAFAAADSSCFSVGNAGGWQLFNSYMSPYGSDSVQLEIIVQHANNINWGQEQYIGKIKINALIPENTQTLSFNLIATNYRLRIKKEDGKCYLRFISGTLPTANPAAIPIKVIYKK